MIVPASSDQRGGIDRDGPRDSINDPDDLLLLDRLPAQGAVDRQVFNGIRGAVGRKGRCSVVVGSTNSSPGSRLRVACAVSRLPAFAPMIVPAASETQTAIGRLARTVRSFDCSSLALYHAVSSAVCRVLTSANASVVSLPAVFLKLADGFGDDVIESAVDRFVRRFELKDVPVGLARKFGRRAAEGVAQMAQLLHDLGDIVPLAVPQRRVARAGRVVSTGWPRKRSAIRSRICGTWSMNSS